MNNDNLVLRPNCLLTKYPLVFITGTRSVFFYEKLGEQLQSFIADHGYMVLSPAMPYRSVQLRKKYLTQWLQQQEHLQFHFVLSKRSHQELSEVVEIFHNSTFTIISEILCQHEKLSEMLNEPLSYQAHKLFCLALGIKADPYNETLQDKSTEFYDRFLDHCIELAENESI